jgi:hypothetical protein
VATAAAATATGGELHGGLLTAAAPAITAPAALARVRAIGAVDDGAHRRWLLLLLLRFATGQVGPSPVTHRDQQCRHVLAMLIRLLKRGASAVGGDALTTQANRHFVRLGIRALDAALRVRFVQADVIDHLTLLVIEATEERAGAE